MDRDVKFSETLDGLIGDKGFRGNRRAILDHVGISPAALSQYVRGHTWPSFQKLVALANFFNVSLDYLVYGDVDTQGVDHSPIAQLVDLSLAAVQARTSHHSALVGRIGRVLSDRVDAVARELAVSETAGQAGLIQDAESARLEELSSQVDVLSLDLGHDVIDVAGKSVSAGHFLDVVTRNLRRGCKYRFLVPSDLPFSLARFRALLAERAGRELVDEYSELRQTDAPLIMGYARYRLDVPLLQERDPALFAQFGEMISTDGHIAYVIRPNRNTNSDLIIAGEQSDRARQSFELLWDGARPTWP